ncbi:MAG: family 43 glycosylhydrolase [Phocaeicola sp.]|uniref:family 43 glycosylhydrolase n=1 Tax=Phocaeicola sp. TaxID=2773926 RepID=UPI003F9ECEF3
MKYYVGLLILVLLTACSSAKQTVEQQTAAAYYSNPVVNYSLPDPTVMQGDDGMFYLFATEDIHNVPILRSRDLVRWNQIGTAFTDATRPTFVKGGGIWAPDINKIGKQYVLYYSMSTWGGEWDCGIGVATSDKIEGPYTDHGMLFRSKDIGVQNSIDPCFVHTKNKNFLFFGSFHGIYFVELTKDGLALMPGEKPLQVAGDAYEGTCIFQKGKYFYLFASIGSCCEGVKSTYTTVVGRAENAFGPYLDKHGNRMMDNNHEIVVHKSDLFVGTGHNSKIVTDRKGNNWMLYHAYELNASENGRILLLDELIWEDGWPKVKNTVPALQGKVPAL